MADASDKKKIVLAVGLLVVTAGVLAYQFWPESSSTGKGAVPEAKGDGHASPPSARARSREGAPPTPK